MAEDSDLEKTESASPRRLEQAREEGQVPQSRELATFVSLIVGVTALYVLGRWGGEEFLLLLPDTSVAQAAACIDRLRDQLQRSPFDEVLR